MTSELVMERPKLSRVARVVLAWFLATFLASRIVVLLIMTRRVPDLFLHVGGAHVHHLNYGIFILSAVGAAILLRPDWATNRWARAGYGVGLGLTIDEFGMWVHLGGSYWQRASFDAVIVVGTVLLLLTVAPSVWRWRMRHWLIATGVVLGVSVLGWLMADSLRRFGERWGEKLQTIERRGPR